MNRSRDQVLQIRRRSRPPDPASSISGRASCCHLDSDVRREGSTKMSEWFVRRFDRCARIVQDRLGPKFSDYVEAKLGSKGTRLVRELLGRSPRFRAQVSCNTEVCGSGV